MDRRQFFRRALERTATEAVRELDRRVAEKAGRWIRPPFALAELEFLLACTRCDACRLACEEGVIVPLSAQAGPAASGTPVLSFATRGCQLCTDWPCVSACETGALARPDEEADGAPALPQLAMATVDRQRCLPWRGPECGACADACPVPDAMVWDQERPHIDPERCCGCGCCHALCVLEPRAIAVKPIVG